MDSASKSKDQDRCYDKRDCDGDISPERTMKLEEMLNRSLQFDPERFDPKPCDEDTPPEKLQKIIKLLLHHEPEPRESSPTAEEKYNTEVLTEFIYKWGTSAIDKTLEEQSDTFISDTMNVAEKPTGECISAADLRDIEKGAKAALRAQRMREAC